MKKQCISTMLVMSCLFPMTSQGESFIRSLMPCTRQMEDARDDMFHESYKKKFFTLHSAQNALSDEKFEIARTPFPLRVINLSYNSLKKMAKERSDVSPDILKKEIQKEIDDNTTKLKNLFPEGSSITVVDLQMGDRPTIELRVEKANGTIFKFEGEFNSRNVHYERKTLKSANPKVHKILDDFGVDTKGITLEEGIRRGYEKVSYLRDLEIIDRELVSKRCHERILNDHGALIAEIEEKNVLQGKREGSKEIEAEGHIIDTPRGSTSGADR